MNQKHKDFQFDFCEILGRDALKNYVIAGHVKPDGDCVGACQALAITLSRTGKNVYVLLEDFNTKYNCIPGAEFIYRGNVNDLNADVFIACDCGSKDRLGCAQDVFDRARITLNLDHHVTNDKFADYNVIDPDASSTCELLFNIISGILPVTPEIETALCAGILYDTGGLRHKSTTPDTVRIIGMMLANDVPLSRLFNTLIYEHSFAEGKALSKVLARMTITEGYPIAVSYIKLSELADIGATTKELDGIVEYMSSTNEVKLAVFVYEKDDNDIKVSLRSKEADVSEIARHFGGGGHKLAAGYNRTGNVAEVLTEATEYLKRAVKCTD